MRLNQEQVKGSEVEYPLSWKLVNGKVYFNWWDFKGLFETKYDELIVLIGRVKEAGGWAWSEAPIEPLPGTIWGPRPSVVFAGGAGNGTPTSPSAALISFLKNYEQFHAMPYRGLDSQNRTVGYGHVIIAAEGTKYDNGITEAAATELLKDDIKNVVQEPLDPFLKNNSIALNQRQYDALISFTFNAGPDWLIKYWGLRNILLSKNMTYEAMYFEFMTWLIAGGGRSLGLYRRRMDELNIFFKGDYSRNYPEKPSWFDNNQKPALP